MATTRISEIIQHLGRTVPPQDDSAWTDGQLLGRFIENRDEAAFAALVRRHGPMVWGVCRRMLKQHDAEDAFQATFLVLVRKAAGVIPREKVANWLHGVAHQTALHARRTIARWQARAKQVTELPERAVVEPDLWRDLQPLLDQELSRLPDAYREVIILMDLEGKTRKEVARQLGLPEGTVGSRLARARAMLAKRLSRHALAVPGEALAAVLKQNGASATVPPSVVFATLRSASVGAARHAAAAIPVKVAALTEGVLKTMLLTKLWSAILVTTALTVLFGLGAGILGHRMAAAEPDLDKRGQTVPARKDGEQAKARTDVEAIQGTWVLVKLEQVNQDPQDPKGAIKVVIAGDKITFPDKSEARFKLDPTRKPKRMEWTVVKGGVATTAPGIYSLQENELKCCVGREGDEEPPASFDIKQAAAGTFPTCWTFRREKAGEPAAKKPVPPPDWRAFDDPAAFLLTDAFAESVKALPPAERVIAVKRLQGSLKSKEVEIRRRAALTLASLGDKSGVPVMMADLSTASSWNRDNVVLALRILRDDRAIPALRKALRDKSPHVRGVAVAALGELKAAAAYDEMVALTKDKEGLRDEKGDGRLNCIPNCPAFSACYALGALGDERAVPVLIALLEDDDLRASARQALEAMTKQQFGNDPEKWKAWWKR
jgi:RNA polymerase sigma factor (sigma-70 family)